MRYPSETPPQLIPQSPSPTPTQGPPSKQIHLQHFNTSPTAHHPHPPSSYPPPPRISSTPLPPTSHLPCTIECRSTLCLYLCHCFVHVIRRRRHSDGSRPRTTPADSDCPSWLFSQQRREAAWLGANHEPCLAFLSVVRFYCLYVLLDHFAILLGQFRHPGSQWWPRPDEQ